MYPDLLSAPAAKVILDPANERYVSLASFWEMQVKHLKGNLELPNRVHLLERRWLEAVSADLLPIEMRHVSALYDLPLHHTDPFDRMIVGQALAGEMVIISPDRHFKAYHVDIIW